MPRASYMFAICTMMLVSASVALGGPIVTFEFYGTVSAVDDPHHLLDGSIQIGTPYLARYSFDPDSSDSYPEDPSRGVYASSYADLDVVVGNLSMNATGTATVLEIGDNVTGLAGQIDFLNIEALSFNAGELHIDRIGALAIDPTVSALSSDAIPLALPPDESFGQRQFLIQGSRDSDTFSIQADLNWVPEPGSLALFVAGLVLISRRRAHSS